MRRGGKLQIGVSGCGLPLGFARRPVK
jgi:hypothetical protein